jgi:hypothetical protein
MGDLPFEQVGVIQIHAGQVLDGTIGGGNKIKHTRRRHTAMALDL